MTGRAYVTSVVRVAPQARMMPKNRRYATPEPRTPTQPGTPAKDVTLSWPTFSAAAAEAGMSRRDDGIHFESGDMDGRALGAAIGQDAWVKAQYYIREFNTGPI